MTKIEKKLLWIILTIILILSTTAVISNTEPFNKEYQEVFSQIIWTSIFGLIIFVPIFLIFHIKNEQRNQYFKN